VLAAAVAIGTVLTGTAAAPAAADVAGPVVLLGTGGVRWPDVGPATPALQSLLDQGSSGWLAVRSVRATTCPTDGWLAVSSGRRAADSKVEIAGRDYLPSRCREPQAQISTPGSAGTVPAWPTYLAEAKAGTFDAEPGMLGDALAAKDLSSAAVGAGAVIALADSQGRVAQAWPGRVDDATGVVPANVLASDVKAALQTAPDLLVVDLGVVRDPAQRATDEPLPSGAYLRLRAEQVRALDARLALVLAELPANATVIVGSLADSGSTSQLQLLAARGPAPLGGAYSESLLGSASTRQDGLTQGTDLLPTLLTALSATVPDEAVGSTVTPVEPGGSAAGRRQKLNDLADASSSVTPIVPWFFLGLGLAQILLYGGAAWILRRRSRTGAVDRAPMLRRLRQAAVVFAAVPAASFLANLLPWWRFSVPGLAVTGAVILFVIPIAAVALLGPWRKALLGPMGIVGAVTAGVLAVDTATGSKLALSSLMGVQPVIAGRFYGFGNVAFALFATGALLAAIAVADWQARQSDRRRAALLVVVIGIVATLIDGAPGVGSDFGGPPALIPAFAMLALMVAGVKITWRRLLLITAVTVLVLIALGVLDWLRAPGDRTHLGRFVQTVLDGGGWSVVQRKAEQNFGMLFGSLLAAPLPFAVAFVVLVLTRPASWGVRPLQLAYDRSPVLRQGLFAFGVMLLLGALLNDSGTAIPAVAATLALPSLIAASLRALELQDAAAAPPPAAADAAPTPPPSPAPPATTTAPPPGGTRG
jgi:hypothetical protein